MNEKLEKAMEKYEAEVKRLIEKSASDFLNGLPRLIHSKLEALAAQCLGFSAVGWNGKWEVDHCNSRNSLIKDYIDEKSTAMAKAAMDKIMTPDAVNKIVEKCKASVLEDFERYLERSIHSHVERMADSVAGSMQNDIIAIIKVKLGCFHEVDIADPKVGESSLSKLVLKRALEDLKKEEDK